MLAIAEKIIDQQSGKFDPNEFVDRYEQALREVIEEKKKGRPVRPARPANDDGKVIDLMQALRNSLKGGGGQARAQAAGARRPASTRGGGSKKSPARRRVA